MQGIRTVDTIGTVVDELGFTIAVIFQTGALDASGYQIIYYGLGAASRKVQIEIVGGTGIRMGIDFNPDVRHFLH